MWSSPSIISLSPRSQPAAPPRSPPRLSRLTLGSGFRCALEPKPLTVRYLRNVSQVTIPPALGARNGGDDTSASPSPPRARWRRIPTWVPVAALVILAAVAFILLTGMRPAYDAYGWLVWGRQAVHLNLDLNAAPSWKPLPFLFTLPYSLIPGQAALWLWMVTAVAGAFAGSVFAARIAYRLSAPAHRYARVAGAVFAAVGVLGIAGYWHFVLIATSDPLMTTLCLGAIDAHLSGRRRLAWALLVLASLGRPEAWLVTAVYALWAWRSEPGLRASLLVGLAAIPVLWFGIPTITSGNPLIAGKIEADSTVALPGNRVTGTLDGFTSLYELPMWIAALAATLLAAVRRERTWIVLIGAAMLWLLTEIAFALHGWAPSPRYMFEPVAVLVVLVGAGFGRVLSVGPNRFALMRWAAVAAVAALLVTLAQPARTRARLAHNGIDLGQTWARQISRLHRVIADVGGPQSVLACGKPVTEIRFQSILAFAMSENVAEVGWNPRDEVKKGKPIVLFEPRWAGWVVRPINVPRDRRAACAGLRANSEFG
jgi:hypothetical protein